MYPLLEEMDEARKKFILSTFSGSTYKAPTDEEWEAMMQERERQAELELQRNPLPADILEQEAQRNAFPKKLTDEEWEAMMRERERQAELELQQFQPQMLQQISEDDFFPESCYMSVEEYAQTPPELRPAIKKLCQEQAEINYCMSGQFFSLESIRSYIDKRLQSASLTSKVQDNSLISLEKNEPTNTTKLMNNDEVSNTPSFDVEPETTQTKLDESPKTAIASQMSLDSMASESVYAKPLKKLKVSLEAVERCRKPPVKFPSTSILSPNARTILKLLEIRANRFHGDTKIYNSRLAKMTKLSVRTIERVLNQLDKAGFITRIITRCYGGNSINTRNHFFCIRVIRCNRIALFHRFQFYSTDALNWRVDNRPVIQANDVEVGKEWKIYIPIRDGTKVILPKLPPVFSSLQVEGLRDAPEYADCIDVYIELVAINEEYENLLNQAAKGNREAISIVGKSII